MKLKKRPEGDQELGKVRREGFKILRPQRVEQRWARHKPSHSI